MHSYNKYSDVTGTESLINRICSFPYTWFILLCLLVLLAYSNTFNAPFVFDDIDNISNSTYTRFNEISWDNIKRMVKSPLNGKRPVAQFSLALNYYFNGYNVPGYHIVNIVIHLINGLLLFILIRKIVLLAGMAGARQGSTTERMWGDTRSKPTMIALFATALWLLNPIQIFSVTYTIQRMNSLSAMFSLLSILMYIKVRKGGNNGDSHKKIQKGIEESKPSIMPLDSRFTISRYYCITFLYGFLAFLFAILAIASKQNAILLPLFIIMVEIYFISDLKLKSSLQFIKKPKLIIAFMAIVAPIVVIFIYIVYYNTAANPWTHIMSLYHGRDFSPIERLLTQPRVVCHYLSLIFYPAPSRMALLVDIPKSTGLLQPVSTLISIIFLSSLFIFALLTAKRKRLLSFAILWFFIGQLLESTIIPLELVYIHRNYMPSMFLFLPIVAWLTTNIGETGNKRAKESDKITASHVSLIQKLKYDRTRNFLLVVLLLTGVIFLFAFWTYSYNSVWENDVTFWADNVKKSPRLPRTYANYGVVLVQSGDYEKAHQAFQQTLKLKPNDTRTLYNIGVAYEQEEKYTDAIKYYSKALLQNGDFADAWRNQGALLVKLGDLKNGLDCLNAAWLRQPYEPVTNYEFGHALILNKHLKRAHFHLFRAINKDPEYVDAILEMGMLYALSGDHKTAKIFFKKAKEFDPKNRLANDFLEFPRDALKTNSQNQKK